jgi:outer membrane protein assembly factor BamB
MRRIIIAVILLTGFTLVYSQEEMTQVWLSKLEHKIVYTGTGMEDRGYSFAASDKEMTVFKNADGKTLWTKPFKELAPKLNKIDELIPFWEGNTVFLFDRKMGKDQIACIDLEKGTYLWSTDKYQDVTDDVIRYIPEEEGFAISLKKSLVFIKMRTGEEVWQTDKFKGVVGKYVYDVNERTMVMVNFVPGAVASLFTGFKNQIAKINVQNGEIIWENTYVGRAERKVLTREFVFDLDVVGNQVILRINGYQVYDYKTGASLWSAAFDFVPEGLVPKPAGTIKFGAYGTVAEPVTVGDDLYILDMSNKKNQFVKKYDKNTGKLLWSSKEIKDARVIPGMYIVGDKVLLQIGGRVETQFYRQIKSGDYILLYLGSSPSGS